ncbi:MAG: hypothetical protein AB7V27_11300 [Candidatus Binatia bacterium]
MGLAVATTSGMFLASKHQMRMQTRELETTQAARAAVDMIVRDLRLGGACLPVTGEFISLSGSNSGSEDQIVTRTGLTRPDLSCIRSTVSIGATVLAGGTRVAVQASEGFAPGMRAYIRHPDGDGEFLDITAVPSATELTKGTTLSRDYPETSGVYAIDERRFFLNWWSSPRGMLPELMLQVGSSTPSSFAVGIEKLDLRYQLRRNCPPCDVVNIPIDNEEWSIVEQVLVSVTARSELPDTNGKYYRRTVAVGVKPRNLLPQ